KAEAVEGGALAAAGGYRTQKLGGGYRGGTIGASPAYCFTAHVAEVSVDEETGIWKVERIWAAHDCGKAINPTLVEGQIEGSVYMGYAEAAMEEMAYLPSGLHKGPSLLDYRIPTTLDTPDIRSLIVESNDPNGPHGAKEAGEGEGDRRGHRPGAEHEAPAVHPRARGGPGRDPPAARGARGARRAGDRRDDHPRRPRPPRAGGGAVSEPADRARPDRRAAAA